jgi:hypothetical protein
MRRNEGKEGVGRKGEQTAANNTTSTILLEGG